MKQILEDLKNGEIVLADVACPLVRPGALLIRTQASLISPGTERSLLEFGRAGLIAKARQQPERVRQVLDKVRTDGLAATYQAVTARLAEPIALGYCNAGEVLETGEGVDDFRAGDRVASNGPHAEVVCVPRNLCARIPDGVSDEAAAVTPLAAIALNGVRLLAPALGETVCVIGLGMVGLLAVELLERSGVRVLALDFDAARVALARRFGAEAVDLATGGDPIALGRAFSAGAGVDGVLITASTRKDDVIHQAAEMARVRGRIVLTGVVGLRLDRADFYRKELTFQVSCSYGPGRYDSSYEEAGHDYPLGFVRWTEGRNFTAVLELMQSGKLEVAPLISRRVRFTDARDAYTALGDGRDVGILLEYDAPRGAADQERLRATVLAAHPPGPLDGAVTVGVLGAGNFARQVLLPALRAGGVRRKWIASAGGVSGAEAARRFGFELHTTECERVLDDPQVDAVFITTRHDSHAALVARALERGKNVFVEKPLCLDEDELACILETLRRKGGSEGAPRLMVGFNRRFAPLTELLRAKLAGSLSPACFAFQCNAGAIPPEHWTRDPRAGGGRIVGEACHFIDLLAHLARAPLVRVTATGNASEDAAIALAFGGGSVGSVNYFTSGAKRVPKERLEVFCDGRVFTLDNFRELRAVGLAGFKRKRLRRQDKGHAAGFQAFLAAVRDGKPSPTPLETLVETTRATLAATRSLATGESVELR